MDKKDAFVYPLTDGRRLSIRPADIGGRTYVRTAHLLLSDIPVPPDVRNAYATDGFDLYGDRVQGGLLGVGWRVIGGSLILCIL